MIGRELVEQCGKLILSVELPKMDWENLDEDERVHYRLQARKVLEFLEYIGMLRGAPTQKS